jgi:hypothetical protein
MILMEQLMKETMKETTVVGGPILLYQVADHHALLENISTLVYVLTALQDKSVMELTLLLIVLRIPTVQG